MKAEHSSIKTDSVADGNGVRPPHFALFHQFLSVLEM